MAGVMKLIKISQIWIHIIADLAGDLMDDWKENRGSRKVEAIKVHHLVPGRDKVVDELHPSIGTSVDFSEGAELGV